MYEGDPDGSHISDVYWTKHEQLVTELIIQNANIEYDILEIQGDDINEVSDICLNQYKIVVDVDHEIKRFYTNEGIEFLSSMDYITNIENSHTMDNIIRILVSSYINICKFMPYVTNQYKSHLEIFLSLLLLYIARIVLFNEVAIEELPINVQKT